MVDCARFCQEAFGRSARMMQSLADRGADHGGRAASWGEILQRGIERADRGGSGNGLAARRDALSRLASQAGRATSDASVNN
jgi:hypothetical protein